MDIRELQYLIAAADAGSLSTAAERMFISQQGLSSAIRRLEAELGYPLLHRGPGGVQLTERGREFYEKATAVVSAFSELLRTFTDPDGRPAVAIACTYNIIPNCPRPLQRLLLNQNPEYSVVTTEHYSSECEDLIESGACSFGIVYGPIDGARFAGNPLFQRNQCIIVNRKHPLAKEQSVRIAQLRDEPLIIPHARSRTNAVMRQIIRDAGFEPRVALECDRPMEIISLVKTNPELVARMFEEDAPLSDPDIATLAISDIPFALDIFLIEKKRRPLTPVERAVRRAVLDSAGFAGRG